MYIVSLKPKNGLVKYTTFVIPNQPLFPLINLEYSQLNISCCEKTNFITTRTHAV